MLTNQNPADFGTLVGMSFAERSVFMAGFNSALLALPPHPEVQMAPYAAGSLYAQARNMGIEVRKIALRERLDPRSLARGADDMQGLLELQDLLGRLFPPWHDIWALMRGSRDGLGPAAAHPPQPPEELYLPRRVRARSPRRR